MRITTNAMVRNYNSNLSNSLSRLNQTRERAADGRRFHRAYEDPTGAMRASSLTQKLLRNEDYTSTIEDCMNRQDSADAVIQQLVGMVGKELKDEVLSGLNGSSSPETRKTYATSFRQMQDSFLQFANSQYQDSYLFAGSDGGKMPFTKGEDGAILYRGINVSTGEWPGHTTQEGLAELQRLSKEKLYVDVGTGLQVDTKNNIAGSSNDINGASAYNMSLPGIGFLGFGSSEGNPPISKNIIALVGELATELENPNFDEKRFKELYTQLTETHSTMTDFNAEVGVNKKFLESSQARLKTERINLITQLDTTQNVVPAEAIMDYNYSQYCYNMVLKVGTSLLSNSFVDFMR